MLKRYACTGLKGEARVNASTEPRLAVILIHGWGLDSLLWEQVIPQLAQHRDVYTYDLSGYGDDLPVNEDDFSGQGDGLLKQSELSIPENYFVVGFSLGGVVASTLGTSPFNKMKGLVTISTNAKFLASEDWGCAMPAEEFEGFANSLHVTQGVSVDTQDISDRVLRRFTALQCKGSQTMRQELSYLRAQQACANKPAIKILQEGLQCLAVSDLRDTWKKISVPSLHQFGAEDKIVPVEAAERLAKTLGNSVQVFERSAHQPFLSEANAWVASINRFASEQLAELQYA